jgi:hypothetical protein
VYAAKHNTSVARIVGEMLQQRMKELREYDEAMRRFLTKKPVRLKRSGARYATRDELHDRGQSTTRCCVEGTRSSCVTN